MENVNEDSTLSQISLAHDGLNGSNVTSHPGDYQWAPPLREPIEIELTFVATQQCVNHVILPIVFSLGILGNILNLVIFTRRRICHRMSEVEKASITGLVSLAISDLLFCIFGLISHVLDSFHQDAISHVTHLSTIAFYYSNYEGALLNTFLFTSTWIITVMSVERWAAARYPFVARRIVSMRKSINTNIFIYAFSIIFNIPQFLKSHVYKTDCVDGGSYCYIKISGKLYENPAVAEAYRVMWAIFGTFVPIILLTFCNIMFLIEIHRSRRNFSTGNTSMLGHTPNTGIKSAMARITAILIGIILCFFILVCPSMILSLLFESTLYNVDDHTFYSIQIAIVITNLTQGLNFAVNFLLYCSMSREFRNTLKKTFCRRGPTRSPSLNNSPTQQGTKLIDMSRLAKGSNDPVTKTSSVKCKLVDTNLPESQF
jgi:hypothetical protein